MRKLNSLVIDNDPAFLEIARNLLEAAGFSVTTCGTGQKALDLAQHESFRLVCCGQNLSDIHGCEFCGQLRSIVGYDFSSLIVLTDEDNSRILKQALLAGATDIFSKNDLDELSIYLQRYADREHRQLSGRVLLIEDSRVAQEIVLDLLTDMGLDVDVYTHAEDGWEAFQNGHYDLVITDVMLEGNMSGITLVRKIRRLYGEHGNVPILATSGFDNISRKIELFHLGVNDYVAKPVVREELRQRVFNHVTSYQKMLELHSQQQSLYSLAMLDELTQLFNRHALREFSGKYFSEASRFNRPLTLAVLDIDHFKKINEVAGHAKADQILAELGTWFKRFVRDEDMVARWSGEEFIFLLPNCDSDTAFALMTRLQKRLSQFKPANVVITVSIGLATTEDDSKHNLNSLFELADRAMYQAKMAGRDCIRVYESESVGSE
ncbi:MAG: diguanylate cyclase [Gammaproteobacteria bacterium]|nr:diguanylate cyclase [Gammaproteobacteria bacterium]